MPLPSAAHKRVLKTEEFVTGPPLAMKLFKGRYIVVGNRTSFTMYDLDSDDWASPIASQICGTDILSYNREYSEEYIAVICGPIDGQFFMYVSAVTFKCSELMLRIDVYGVSSSEKPWNSLKSAALRSRGDPV